MSGYPGIAGSISQICGKSAFTVPEQFFYTSMGGSWGAHLKLAGYDGVIVHGKSEKPSALWGKDATEVNNFLKGELGRSTRVLATGPAGENLVTYASTLADEDAAAWGAAIMGSKKLKAIAVRGDGSRPPVANPEKLEALVKYLREMWHGVGVGATLSHIPSLSKKKMICYGCPTGCVRTNVETTNGIKIKVCCQAAGFYRPAADAYYGKSTDVPLHASRLCQDWGLETHVMASILRWFEDGRNAGVLTEANTELPLSKYGSWEFIETLVKKISLREGFGDALAQGVTQAADFGDALAQGVTQAADSIGREARELITDYLDKNGQNMVYGPRLYNVCGILYATEPRMSLPVLHEMTMPLGKWKEWVKGAEGAYMSYDRLQEIGQRFWGSELAFDCSTNEGKAITAKENPG
jgi:aldehyde:ferredoxin oxidoreductase